MYTGAIERDEAIALEGVYCPYLNMCIYGVQIKMKGRTRQEGKEHTGLTANIYGRYGKIAIRRNMRTQLDY